MLLKPPKKKKKNYCVSSVELVKAWFFFFFGGEGGWFHILKISVSFYELIFFEISGGAGFVFKIKSPLSKVKINSIHLYDLL